LQRSKKNNKGFILVLASLTVIVVLGLSAAFFLRSVGEKHIIDVEKFTMQADFLAEAGANHGICELRDRIGVDFSANVNDVSDDAVFNTYYVNGDSLGLLRDYAYVQGNQQFSISGDEATLTLTPLSMVTNVNGSYSATITITQASEPTSPEDEEYNFFYNYLIQGTGTSSAITPNISKQVNLAGSFSVMVKRDNLARYALFTNHHSSASGGAVWFIQGANFYGPMRTNESFRFANNPGTHFYNEVKQHLDEAWFYNNRNNIQLNDDHNGIIDVPTFDNGFERGVGTVALQTVVNGASEKSQALGGITEPTSNGVYLPNSNGVLTGGIFIKGNANSFSLTTDQNNNPKYTINTGSGYGNSTEIVINYTNNTTTKKVGASIQTYSGVPNGIDDEGILVYATGKIEKVSGTVQQDSVVTISAEQDVTINGNIQYQNYNAGPPINANGTTNMLGLVSFGGNVRITSDAPSNINIHGIVMAPNGQFTVDNYSSISPKGTATLLGGVVSNYYGPFGTFNGSTLNHGYQRNFVHDGRVLIGQTPPYFLFMTNFVSDDSGLEDRPIWQKVE
jgi:hypothetical protein